MTTQTTVQQTKANPLKSVGSVLAKPVTAPLNAVKKSVDTQLEKRRIANAIASKTKFVGKKAVEDLPNDKWFVKKAITEYKTNPKFKAGADAVMKPLKIAAGLAAVVMTGAAVAAFAGTAVALAAAVGTGAMAVGAFTLAPGLKHDFDQASEQFKEKVLPPFMLKMGMNVFGYSSREKIGDLAEGAWDRAGDAKQKLSGFLKKKFSKGKTAEAPTSNQAPVEAPVVTDTAKKKPAQSKAAAPTKK